MIKIETTLNEHCNFMQFQSSILKFENISLQNGKQDWKSESTGFWRLNSISGMMKDGASCTDANTATAPRANRKYREEY